MRKLFRGAVIASILLFVTPAHAAFSALYGYGDSLSDNGNAFLFLSGVLMDPDPYEPTPYMNLVPSKPYAISNTFSDGPVWLDYIAADLGLPFAPSNAGGTNFALGGSRTGTLNFGGTIVTDPFGVLTQAQFSTLGGPLPSDALYAINGGGNDVRKAAELVGTAMATVPEALDAMAQGASNLAQAISTLAFAGARHFVIPNVPDVGRTPAFQAEGPLAAGLATSLVQTFNAALDAEIAALMGDPTLNIFYLDNFQLTNHILDNPGIYGLTNATDPCTLQNAGAGCATPATYAFWDGIHPTTAVQRIAADAALAAVPVPAAVWLFVSAGAILAGLRRRA